MARLPNNPSLLVMFASFVIEARKDGQAARTQLQLAQKSASSLLDNYNVYVAQQLSKQLKRGESGVDSGCQLTLRQHGLSPVSTRPYAQHWLLATGLASSVADAVG